MNNLTKKRCVPCEGGIPKLPPAQVKKMLLQVPGWEADSTYEKIVRAWKFKNFTEAMEFVNSVADLAEEENHHPDFEIHYSKVALTLWTHAVGGLSDNDFILAAKINAL